VIEGFTYVLKARFSRQALKPELNWLANNAQEVSLQSSDSREGKYSMLATPPRTDTIAITRTFDGIEEAAHRVISQIGGMASVIREAKVAVLKPNFVAGRSAETGSTTSFALLKAMAEEVHACGAEPMLCETPGTEFDREATYTILGVEKFCAENGIRIVCVKTCPLPGVLDLKTLKVNYKTYQRCLLCYEACPENAISVKGYSGTRRPS
jgi:NAD-dependent dihydropyrimidine dehydrogenase PreA subunit